MDCIKITLRPQSAFGTPLHGDTLFGHFCWAMRYLEGNDALETFLRRQDDTPALLLSDGFLDDEFPRPVLKSLPPRSELSTEDVRAFKKRKKVNSLPREYLEPIRDNLSGESFDEALKNYMQDSDLPQKSREEARLRVRINRFIDSVSESALFQEMETFYAPGVRLTVYAALHDFDDDRFRRLLDAVAQSGYGRDATVGLGAFSIDSVEQIEPLVRESDTHLMTLSACVPSPTDSTEALYDIMTKYGKLGGLYARKGDEDTPIALKYPLVALKPGATFRRQNGSVYTGGMVKGVYPPNDKIRHYGYALCWGFRQAEKEAVA